MHRFYMPSPAITQNILTITNKNHVNQIGRVFRMKPGDRFNFFDETGIESTVQILEIDRKKITAQIIEKINRETESKIEISLYQAIPKKTALFEWVIQKATELGVAHIYPLITQRTEKRRLSKFERMQTIAIEATEQSRRLNPPIIHHPISLEDALKQIKNGYVAYEFEAGKTLPNYLPEIQKKKSAQILIGPEGGFAHDELELVKKSGIQPFTLGPRILRTETAAIVSLGLVLTT